MSSIRTLKSYRALIGWVNKNFPVAMTKLRFKKYFHRSMNLKNPQDINEKISWLELYSDTSEWTRLADKYAVREYVKECGLEDTLNTLYGRWDREVDIDWDKFPNQFVLKSNNGSGTVMVIKDKSSLNIPEVVVELNHWLTKKVVPDTTEYHYWPITPCLIAEELLIASPEEQKISSSLVDYKIWCFHGKPFSCWTCYNREGDSTDVMTYDLNWNAHPEWSVFTEHYRGKLLPKPKNFDRMIEVASKLSSGFPEMRVDLYNIDGRIYFGECTFTSLGGTMNFYTDDYLLEMGRQVDLGKVKKVKKHF